MLLQTPPLPLRVPGHVFDAFQWEKSATLEWRRPAKAWDTGTPLDGSDPARMVFVFKRECDFLPKELASLHAFGLGLTDEWALAPYAIDDATDELYRTRTPPKDLLWLAADNLNALVWGLHDWAHFHNHGPFEERAFTELQCDASALYWLTLNSDLIGLDADTLERVKRELIALGRGRFASENKAFDPSWLDL